MIYPISRPKGSKDKAIKPGMRIVCTKDGDIQAVHRVGKNQVVMGRIIGQGAIDTSKGEVSFVMHGAAHEEVSMIWNH